MTQGRHAVIVVGGGVTGLATAWWLKKSGLDVLVLESDDVVGGTMKTIREDGWLIESGPNTALETTPLFGTLGGDCRIAGEVRYGNEQANRRYILRGGTLHLLPMTPGGLLGSRLWSWRGKLRLAGEPFIGRGRKDETIAEFVERRLGREFLDYAINPFVAGVYAGDPARLSVRAAFPKLYALEERYGGLIRGQIQGARERKRRAEKAKDRARLFSYAEGMQTLPEALGRALGGSLLTGAAVQEIRVLDSVAEGARFEVQGKHKGGPVRFFCSVLVTAVPADRAAGLIRPLDPAVASALREIPYPPVAEVFLGFRADQVRRPLDGFGFLVPEKERRQILGTLWSSTLFEGRAPKGHVALTTFIGGSRQSDLALKPDGILLDSALSDLRPLLGIDGKPAIVRIIRWQRAIPQYEIGHLEKMRSLQEFEQRIPGLFVTGNFRGGISVGDCMVSADQTALRVRKHLQGSPAMVAAV